MLTVLVVSQLISADKNQPYGLLHPYLITERKYIQDIASPDQKSHMDRPRLPFFCTTTQRLVDQAKEKALRLMVHPQGESHTLEDRVIKKKAKSSNVVWSQMVA
jgi:hypothetical protein